MALNLNKVKERLDWAKTCGQAPETSGQKKLLAWRNAEFLKKWGKSYDQWAEDSEFTNIRYTSYDIDDDDDENDNKVYDVTNWLQYELGWDEYLDDIFFYIEYATFNSKTKRWNFRYKTDPVWKANKKKLDEDYRTAARFDI